MPSKCAPTKWASKRTYRDHTVEVEVIHIDQDNSGALTGRHEPSGKQIGGRCLGGGMTLQRLSAGGNVEIDYVGDFDDPDSANPQSISGRFTDYTRHGPKRLDGSDGDWTAIKTT